MALPSLASVSGALVNGVALLLSLVQQLPLLALLRMLDVREEARHVLVHALALAKMVDDCQLECVAIHCRENCFFFRPAPPSRGRPFRCITGTDSKCSSTLVEPGRHHRPVATNHPSLD